MMQEAVSRYIAIRPFDAIPAAAMEQDDDTARVDAIREDLRASAEELPAAGLEYAAALAEIPSDPAQGGYVTLPQFNALVLEPPAGTPKETLREALGDGYVVVPNFELALPDASLGQAVAAADVKAVLDALPEHTGIQQSREESNSGAGAVVAVLDTGCDSGHTEFRDRSVTFASVVPDVSKPINRMMAFDPGSHGTHVSGIVAGKVVGIAPDVDLITASVMESDTFKTTALRVVKALYWLVELLNEDAYKGKPVILNMSLGFDPKKIPDAQMEDLASTLEAMHRLIQQLVEARQILPVVAIGNSGPDTSCAPGFFPECLAVGAIDYESAEWPDSSGGFGPEGFDQECNPDISGYGVDVVSAVPRSPEGDSLYERKSGTSMATPYVTAIAALVAAKTQLEGTELRTHLLEHALPLQLSAERAGKGLARYAL